MITEEEIENMINEVKVGDAPLNNNINLIDSGVLDSFSILVFMTEFKTRYDMHISMDEDIRDIFYSVESIYNYINETEIGRVQLIVAKALNLTIEEVPPDAIQENFSDWDSMAYLSILSSIEDEFGVSISEENIDKFGGVLQIMGEIRKCQKK